MAERRQVQPGTRDEAQCAESMLYGILWSLLNDFGPLIRLRFEFEGADIHPTDEPESGIIYDGLTIRMKSGEYRVTIEQVSHR